MNNNFKNFSGKSLIHQAKKLRDEEIKSSEQDLHATCAKI